MSRQRAASWREQTIERLARAAGSLPPPEGRKPAWDEWVDIDHWTWARAVECGASLAAPSEPFVDSVPNSVRRVGLATLRAWFDGAASEPHAAATLVVSGDRGLADEDDVPYGLRTWIDELDPQARAALAAESATYALRAARVGVRRGHHVHAPDRARRRWEVPGSRLRLDAKVEVASSRAATSPDLKLLVLDTTSPTPDRAGGLAAWVGLCHTLVCQMVPASVTVKNLRTGGSDRFVADDALLGTGLDQAELAATSMASAATEAIGSTELTYRPGRWCHRCAALDQCEDGLDWVATPHPAAI